MKITALLSVVTGRQITSLVEEFRVQYIKGARKYRF
jgi:hypothetical protein